MQLNCKLGGELWAVKIPLKRVMAIGIDVYHSPVGSGKRLSTVGFVSSLSSKFTQWYTSTALHNPGEIVTSIKMFLIKAIEKYVEHSGFAPDNIVVFRDGVGFGQFNAVRTIELNAFYEGFKAYQSDYQPKFTFVVIMKRNTSRLYETNVSENSEALMNPKPGTVVDNLVTQSSETSCPSFYLISQHFNQGTVTPSHYQVLHNDSNLTLRQIQLLSYKCTYLYYNWPGTISVPAPCQVRDKFLRFIILLVRT